MAMAYVYLAAAIIFEVLGTLTLKYTEGFTKVIPIMLTLVCHGICFVALAATLKSLPVSVVYSIWAGVGTAAMALIGMALFKLGFFSNKPRTSTYAIGAVVGYAIGIPIGWLIFKEGYGSLASTMTDYVDKWRMNPFTLYDVRRVFLSIAHASLIMLVFRSKIVPWLIRALANVGQMAFSNYLMQSIICTWFFYGYGFGNYNKLRFHQLYYVVFAVWIFQLIVSSIWLRYFRFGPFEWLWRSLTYWRRQPMRK